MNKYNANDDDDDLPPELEDIPEDVLTQQAKKPVAGKGNVNLGDYAQPKSEAPIQKSAPVEPQKEEQKKGEAFGGLKKGFFSSQPKPKAPASQTAKTQKDDIIEIKPTQKKDPRVLDEVQDAMKMNQTLLDKKQEWMSPDLLNKIAANPRLAKLFTNPEYMQAITMMQKQPKEAMMKYGGNPEFQELLLEFSKIMGNHFEEMGKKEQASAQQTAQGNAGPPRDPKAEEYLMDPKVKSVVQYLQNNPKIDFNMLLRHDPDLAQKFKYLIEKGYFQIHAG